MENNEFYTYKEVLLALREIYKDNKAKLDALKKHLELPNNATEEDLIFYYQLGEFQKALRLEVNRKRNMLEALFNYMFTKLVGNAPENDIKLSISYNGNENHLILPKDVEVKDNGSGVLYYYADKILESDFLKTVKFTDIMYDQSRMHMQVTPGGIRTYTDELLPDYVSGGFIYSGGEDKMRITGYYDYLDAEQVHRVLNARLPKYRYTYKQQEIIDSSIEKNKDVEILGLTQTKDTQIFEFIDQEDKVVLVRKKQ